MEHTLAPIEVTAVEAGSESTEICECMLVPDIVLPEVKLVACEDPEEDKEGVTVEVVFDWFIGEVMGGSSAEVTTDSALFLLVAS